MEISLSGKRAIVCGSTQGIGRAAAQIMARLGANITLVARNEQKLNETLLTLHKDGDQSHDFIIADFNDPEELRQSVTTWMQKNEPAHILVNNTGGPAGGPVYSAGLQEFENAFRQHLLCNQVLVQAFAEGMKTLGYGRIINVISTSVKQPLPNLGVSNTIRGAVANWSKTMANELGRFNITVNNVLPGATATGRLQSIAGAKAEKTGVSPDAVLSEMAKAVPMQRIAQPEEVGNAIAFLASPAASYINGINLPVDGGRTSSL